MNYPTGLPCKKCGREPVLLNGDLGWTCYSPCGCTGEAPWKSTDSEAVIAWNESQAVDYVALQKELSERSYRGTCDNCETKSYDRIYKEAAAAGRIADGVAKCVLGDGYEHSTTHAGAVKRCESCRTNVITYAWIADIAPARFAAFCEAHNKGAFALEELRPLLDKKPADDGGGFRML